MEGAVWMAKKVGFEIERMCQTIENVIFEYS